VSPTSTELVHEGGIKVAGSPLSMQLVRFLPVPERVQDHIASKNVIPEPVFFPADSPLPFARFACGEFLDLMLPTEVVRIATKNGQQFLHRVHYRDAATRDCAEVAFEAGGD
jgi:hypothetical protein